MLETVNNTLKKYGVAVYENPTNLGKEDLVGHLVKNHGRTLFISQSYDISRQWNEHPEVVKNTVFITYNQFSAISHDDIYDFCSPYSLIILDEAHHAGAKGYLPNILRIIKDDSRTAKVLGITTHTKRYSDAAEDVAYTVFEGHKVNGISFEDAIRKNLLPQFDYISALYSLPKDIDDLVASSSLAKRIVSDSRLVQVNEEGIKEIIRKHMPDGNRKVVFFVPTIEDSIDAEKMALELGYGAVHVINYTKSDKDNWEALEAYNEANEASLICISKFNEGAIPKGTNTVVVLRRTATINIFERQVLTALFTATEKPVVYDFVSNIDNLIYSKKESDEQSRSYYTERVKSLCSQSIVIDYARQWTSVFNKLRSLNPGGWTPQQDEQLRRYYPKYGKEIYRYIKGHNLKECMLRAEILGIEYIKPVAEKKEKPQKKLFVFDDKKMNNIPGIATLPKKFISAYIGAYISMLSDERTSMSSKLQNQVNALKASKIDDEAIKHFVVEMANACIEATIVNDENGSLIRSRQEKFKAYILGYVNSYGKKSSNVVILGGKALKADSDQEIKRQIKEKQLEKKRENMVLVGNSYMDKKNCVAGLYGDTTLEHILYKAYWRLLIDQYKTDHISQFMKEYSPEDIAKRIDNLRNRENPWTDEEIALAKSFVKGKNNTYPTLVRMHSDLDILKKSSKVGSEDFTLYCKAKTAHFEGNYKAFMKKYEELFDVKRFEEEKKHEQLMAEEERRKKKKADIERLKTLKPTVVLVSKHKGQQ